MLCCVVVYLSSIEYGAKYGDGDVVGVTIDFDAGAANGTGGTVSFSRNGVDQGVAYSGVVGPVAVACSMTATGASVTFVDAALIPSPAADTDWDFNVKSPALVMATLHAASAAGAPSATDQSGVMNSGSDNKWQSIRSVRQMSGPGKHVFEVEIVAAPKTPNSWQVIVGVVPASFTCTGQKQWVGAAESWGYIGGTGGKCFNEPKSIPYGEEFGLVGDIIRVVCDFDAGTIEFWKNARSQGVAFTNLKGPVHAACSLTATGAAARLRFPLAGLFG